MIESKKIPLLDTLKHFFQKKAEQYFIEIALLFGSMTGGHPRKESDIDIALLFEKPFGEEIIFEVINTLSIELTDVLKKSRYHSS